MAEAFRCSDAARERADPMQGTAPPQPRILLVEQDGGWQREAISSLPLPDDLRDELRGRTTAASTRVMLIRRPGRQSSSVCMMRSWCLVAPHAPPGRRVTWGTWAYPTELLSAVDLAEELATLGESSPGRAPQPVPQPPPQPPAGVDEPLILVCTHGKKDVCCAVRGRPVAAELARRWPEPTWECSHTGGDRFAANVILLPDGATYGGLDPDLAVTAVAAHLDGAPDLDHVRGQVGQPRVAQSALVAAYRETGLPWGAVQVVDGPRRTSGLPEQEIGERADELAATGEVVARWEVGLATRGGPRFTAAVAEHLRPAAPLTCSAGAPGHSRVAVVEGLARLEQV